MGESAKSADEAARDRARADDVCDLAALFREEERRWRRELLPRAILATLAAHIVLIIWILNAPPLADTGAPARNAPVEIALSDIPEFVETNPLAPEAKAPPTNQTAEANQISAQPKPLPRDDGRNPTLTGTVAGSQKIVENTPPPSPPAPPQGSPEAREGSTATVSARVDLPKTDIPPTESGYARGELQPESESSATLGEPTPLPRPRLEIPRPPAPLRESLGGVSRLGVVAIDAKFTEFGAYQQRMMEAVSAQWNLLAGRYHFTSRDLGTRVEVAFSLDKNGVLKDFKIEGSSASRAATLLCQDAVISRAPFGPWTEAMVRTLGDETPVRIRFFYQ